MLNRAKNIRAPSTPAYSRPWCTRANRSNSAKSCNSRNWGSCPRRERRRLSRVGSCWCRGGNPGRRWGRWCCWSRCCSCWWRCCTASSCCPIGNNCCCNSDKWWRPNRSSTETGSPRTDSPIRKTSRCNCNISTWLLLFGRLCSSQCGRINYTANRRNFGCILRCFRQLSRPCNWWLRCTPDTVPGTAGRTRPNLHKSQYCRRCI